MEFLYPTSRQYPVDEVCEQIVRELEKRNWDIPSLEIDFSTYGTGDSKFRYVNEIKGKNFKLYFGRKQGSIPNSNFNDVAAIHELTIPQKQLHIYDDESGPTFYVYVGSDYKNDQDEFFGHSKVHSKRRGEPRKYLQYGGVCNCGSTSMEHTHPGRRPPLLVHDNDLGREYDPEEGDALSYRTSEVLGEFKEYLKNEVLEMVTAHPVPEERINIFSESEEIPLPDFFEEPFFSFCTFADAKRIRTGKKDPEVLNPSDRYALLPGRRLVSLRIPSKGSFPQIAHDGFIWCGISDGKLTESSEIPGHYRWGDSDQFIVRIKPNRANDIYIADHGEYERVRQDIGSTILNRDYFSDEEVARFTRARASTIIPISEYRGGFEQPLILINRELSFDEVEVVKDIRSVPTRRVS